MRFLRAHTYPAATKAQASLVLLACHISYGAQKYQDEPDDVYRVSVADIKRIAHQQYGYAYI